MTRAGTAGDSSAVRSALWQLGPWEPDRQIPLIQGLQVHPVVAQLLLNRGIATPEDAAHFLHADLSALPSPFLLSDMQAAVNRLQRAVLSRESICIYGDYDMDGISATAILMSVLKNYQANVRLFIPDRERDGYGLQRAPLERLIPTGIKLLITCDNGTSAHEPIQFAMDSGVDVIVTDHHTLPAVLPNALAVLNPRRPETPEALKPLSGAGVAFMLALALRKSLREPTLSEAGPPGDSARPLSMGGTNGHYAGTHPNLRRLLDLVCLGTIADVVPLSGVNRILVRYGLEELQARRRVGLRVLMETAGLERDEEVSTVTVGFRLAPRLNAAGRLSDASPAVQLLLTDDADEARRIALGLEQLNRERQALEEVILKDITAELASTPPVYQHSHVFASERWHPGVVGIVAARVVELTHRPTIVLAIRHGQARGSARSVSGVHLVSALDGCAEQLERYGGHAMAAGLSLQAGHVEALRARFDLACRDQLSGAAPRRVLKVDAPLELHDINEQLVAQLETLGPFGEGNPEPVFSTQAFEVTDRREVGRGHLRLRLSHRGVTWTTIGFRMASLGEELARGRIARLAYCPRFNLFRGRRTIQLRLQDYERHQSLS